MLALNATIEAGRAGDACKGFAIEIAETAVAGETDAGAEAALAAAAALQEQAVSLKGHVAFVCPWFETALRASSP